MFSSLLYITLLNSNIVYLSLDVMQTNGGGNVVFSDYSTNPSCSTLFNAAQLWIVAMNTIKLQSFSVPEFLMFETD